MTSVSFPSSIFFLNLRDYSNFSFPLEPFATPMKGKILLNLEFLSYVLSIGLDATDNYILKTFFNFI